MIEETLNSAADAHWVFGYGSLIFKVDFPILERRVACIEGWTRRFWQGSHDHRGTERAPGRVVTLVPESGAICKGVAYRVTAAVFEHLDHREKNGYRRVETALRFVDAVPEAAETATGLTYIATADNPAFLGAATLSEIARHIHRSRGPSGSNRDYLLQLAQALRQLDAEDSHVFALEQTLLTL